jgi:hypothetical protein
MRNLMKLMNMRELSRATGIPSSTLSVLVKAGYLTPESQSTGRGVESLFSEKAIQQVERAVCIRRWLGDGEAAREALGQLAENPHQSEFFLADKRVKLSFA